MGANYAELAGQAIVGTFQRYGFNPCTSPDAAKALNAVTAAVAEAMQGVADSHKAELASLREQENEYKRVIAASGRMRAENERLQAEVERMTTERDAATRRIEELEAQEKFLADLCELSAEHPIDLEWRGMDGKPTAFVNCSDLFDWGSADCEEVTPENFPMLVQAIEDAEKAVKYGGIRGDDLFCARVRGCRPQGAAYTFIRPELWPLFDACGPERETGVGNPYKPGEYKPENRDVDAELVKANRRAEEAERLADGRASVLQHITEWAYSNLTPKQRHSMADAIEIAKQEPRSPVDEAGAMGGA